MTAGNLARGRAVIALALAAALAACGVPGHTGVTAEGQGPDRGSTGAGSAGLSLPGPRSATNDKELVEFFLLAASGNNPEETPKRLREFLAKDAVWQPQTKDVTVVRVEELVAVETATNHTRVDATLRPVGRLTADGIVDEPPDETVRKVSFDVVPGAAAGGGDRRLVPPPTDAIYLSSSALIRFFTPHPIYFWDTATTTLVPDLRYLPSTIPEAKRPEVIVRWVLNGPSRTLNNVVKHTSGIEQKDAAVVADDRVVVNLNARARDAGDPAKLVQQLRWSLREAYSQPVSLKIEKVLRAESNDNSYESANRATRWGDATRYCVVGRRIAQLKLRPNNDPPVCDIDGPRPAVVGQDAETNVLSGAITRDATRAALVQQAGTTNQQLVIRQAEQEGTVPTVIGPFRRIGRPVWLTRDRALVPVDGQLRELVVTGKKPSLTKDPVPVGSLTDITAVAAAPDGQRVALVAGGRAYVAVFAPGNATALPEARPLPTSVDTIVGIGWSQPDRVVVGGSSGGRGTIAEITMDGAVEAPFKEDVVAPYRITQLVAYPSNPVIGRTPGAVMIEADGSAMTVYKTSKQFVTVTTPNAPKVTAPFFAD